MHHNTIGKKNEKKADTRAITFSHPQKVAEGKQKETL